MSKLTLLLSALVVSIVLLVIFAVVFLFVRFAELDTRGGLCRHWEKGND